MTDAGDSRSVTARLFDRNAARYDAVNTVITLGMDRRWRHWLAATAVTEARRLSARPRVLDACAGTGLVGLEAARLGAEVTLLEASPGMLARARERARRIPVGLVEADLDAAPAPLPDGSFQAVVVAFGIRYFADPEVALGRLVATLVPGGTLAVLEAVVPPPGLLCKPAEWYFFSVARRVGAVLAGSRELSDRLTESVAALGRADAVVELLRAAGLTPVERRSWAGGLVTGVVARRPLGPVSPKGAGRVARGSVSSRT